MWKFITKLVRTKKVNYSKTWVTVCLDVNPGVVCLWCGSKVDRVMNQVKQSSKRSKYKEAKVTSLTSKVSRKKRKKSEGVLSLTKCSLIANHNKKKWKYNITALHKNVPLTVRCQKALADCVIWCPLCLKLRFLDFYRYSTVLAGFPPGGCAAAIGLLLFALDSSLWVIFRLWEQLPPKTQSKQLG